MYEAIKQDHYRGKNNSWTSSKNKSYCCKGLKCRNVCLLNDAFSFDDLCAGKETNKVRIIINKTA